MIHVFDCVFGLPVNFDMAQRFGERVEIEAIEFIGGLPLEWKIGNLPWRPGKKSGQPYLETFHDLQFPVPGGTKGTPVGSAQLFTRGIGDAKVMVWLREGTYSERKTSSGTLPILQPKTADSGCA